MIATVMFDVLTLEEVEALVMADRRLAAAGARSNWQVGRLVTQHSLLNHGSDVLGVNSRSGTNQSSTLVSSMSYNAVILSMSVAASHLDDIVA